MNQQRELAWQALIRQREADLRALAAGNFGAMSAAGEPIREDLTQRREAYLMSKATGYDSYFIEEMAGFGRLEGFDVLVADYVGGGSAGDPANIRRIDVTGATSENFAEDSGQAFADGSLSVGTPLDLQKLVNRLAAARKSRGAPIYGVDMPWDGPNVPHQGAAARDGTYRARLAFGVASGRKMRLDLGYLERGNVLIGTRGGGGAYALVGRDSVVTSRVSIEVGFESIGLPPSVSDEQVRVAIAKDIGIAPSNIIVVDQPAFHIDMAMTPWTPNVVLLSDVNESMKVIARTHGIDMAARFATVRGIAEAERMVEGQLRAAGLKVVRVPGRFPAIPGPMWASNFLNGEGGVGQASTTYWITQGGPTVYANAFADAVRASGEPVPRIHYLNAQLSAVTLYQLTGGINCRAVPITSTSRPASSYAPLPRPRPRPGSVPAMSPLLRSGQ